MTRSSRVARSRNSGLVATTYSASDAGTVPRETESAAVGDWTDVVAVGSIFTTAVRFASGVPRSGESTAGRVFMDSAIAARSSADSLAIFATIAAIEPPAERPIGEMPVLR